MEIQPFNLTHLPKTWALAKRSRHGWQVVARFPTFGAALTHSVSMNACGMCTSISRIADGGGCITSIEYRINAIRAAVAAESELVCPDEYAIERSQAEINRLIIEAHIWAARQGKALEGGLRNGLVKFWITAPPEEEAC